MVQAGASEAGKSLAARTAEVIFIAHQTLQEAQSFYADIKTRAQAAGRSPDAVKIDVRAVFPLVAKTSRKRKKNSRNYRT